MRKIAFLSLTLGLFLLAGCANQSSAPSSPKTSSVDYPKLYVDEKLPQYPDAKLAQIITNGSTLKEGVLLRLESQKDVKTIAAYYDEQMAKLGWTMPAKNEATETSYATQYNNGKKYVQLTVSQITGSGQTITLNFMEQ
ncbi:MAG: hypothetical protein ACD_15C00164G0001 [uncultured bacterium]|nr:MAG: hypothetical protein ACD_15C00164G0001 [uncultured bacterium]